MGYNKLLCQKFQKKELLLINLRDLNREEVLPKRLELPSMKLVKPKGKKAFIDSGVVWHKLGAANYEGESDVLRLQMAQYQERWKVIHQFVDHVLFYKDDEGENAWVVIWKPITSL